MGGHGSISVTANVAPRAMSEMCAAARRGDRQTAIAINTRLMALHTHLFVEPNPIPVKWALTEMGRIESGIRLPLTPLEPKHHAIVKSAMQAAGVVQQAKETA